jgi:hypothetical protein
MAGMKTLTLFVRLLDYRPIAKAGHLDCIIKPEFKQQIEAALAAHSK